MARAPFSIFRRSSRDSKTGKVAIRYCARFFDEDFELLKTKTLKAKNQTQAVLEAKSLLDKGEGKAKSDPLILDFLNSFWKVDSDYAKMKALRGRALSLKYVEGNRLLVGKHLGESLKGVKLHSLTISRVERVVLGMADKGTNARTITTVIQALRVPVSDYSRKHRMPDPLQYLGKAAESPKGRGTLSIDEIAKIVGLLDESPRVRCATLLGALCGLRLGEVAGLQWEDVDVEGGVLHIVHNFQEGEGLKKPKCGSSRDVPLPAVVLVSIEVCRSINPNGSSFVLWNDRGNDRPAHKVALERGFHHILDQIGIAEEEQKMRNLVFHGLRHSYVSITRATGLPDFAVMRLAGHKSLAMTERYSHSENVVDFAAARLAINGAVSQSTSRIS